MSIEQIAPGVAAGPGSRIGADLRDAREQLGWTLPAMAAHLRIRLPFLEAIEEGRLGDLPGNAYAVGFLRTYAKALGLDPEEIARRFRAEAADVNRKTELSFPAPVPERGIPAGAIVLLGVVIAAGAYVGWYRMSGDRPSAEPPHAVPERLAPLAETAVPKPPPAVASLPASAPAPAPAPATASPQPSTTSRNATSPAATSNAATSSASAAQPPAPATPASRPVGVRIVLRAKSEAWVQVRERQGAVLIARVLRAGEVWPVPVRPNLLLTTGNAAATELLVDGVVAPSLGADGAVRRDVPLDDLDMIREGKLTQAQPAAVAPISPASNAAANRSTTR